MRLDYHDYSEQDFERLVVAICIEILGSGVAPFCKGPDGGRDARFEGTAECLPSRNRPYSGKFIIQAKHTDSPIAKFSESDFSGDAESSVLSGEIPKIKSLVEAGELEHYLLFSNRKMSGLSEEPIRRRISQNTGARVVELFGIERMDALLKRHREALRTFEIQPLHLPLLITCDSLSEVITAISVNKNSFKESFKLDQLQRVSFKDKNLENGLSDEYASCIRKNYLPSFADVKKFLADPSNAAVVEHYDDAAKEFDEQIAIYRRDFAKFDHVLNRLVSLLLHRDSDLRANKALTKVVLYYMYWNCDIGELANADATAE